jgi:hypothetical protein
LTGTQPDEHAGSSIAGTGDIDGNGDGDFVVGAPDKDVSGDPNAGTVYLVTSTEIPFASGCGPLGCTVSDLANGAQVSVPAGALAANVNIVVTGIVDAGALPGAVPGERVPRSMASTRGADLCVPVRDRVRPVPTPSNRSSRTGSRSR